MFKTKTSPSRFLFFVEDDVFTFGKIWILVGYFQFLQQKKVLTRDICFAAKTKNTLEKVNFGQNKDITPKIYGILKE